MECWYIVPAWIHTQMNWPCRHYEINWGNMYFQSIASGRLARLPDLLTMVAADPTPLFLLGERQVEGDGVAVLDHGPDALWW